MTRTKCAPHRTCACSNIDTLLDTNTQENGEETEEEEEKSSKNEVNRRYIQTRRARSSRFGFYS